MDMIETLIDAFGGIMIINVKDRTIVNGLIANAVPQAHML
jgi:hypothetical protein